MESEIPRRFWSRTKPRREIVSFKLFEKGGRSSPKTTFVKTVPSTMKTLPSPSKSRNTRVVLGPKEMSGRVEGERMRGEVGDWWKGGKEKVSSSVLEVEELRWVQRQRDERTTW